MRFSILAAMLLSVFSLAALADESYEAAGRTITYRTALDVLERDADDRPVMGKPNAWA